MDQIGEMYQLHFIHVCEPPPLRRFCFSDGLLIVKKYKGATPVPSSPRSRPHFDTKNEMIKDMLSEAPQHHDQAKKNVSRYGPHIFSSEQSPRPSSGMVFGASLLANMILNLC